MFFEHSFYFAAIVCFLGMIYRLGHWFSYRIGSDTDGYSAFQRMGHVLAAVCRTIFSIRIFKLAYTLVVDVILQVRILRRDPLRWVMHFSIFAGFMLLLFMHALEDEVTRSFFPGYESTLNPYMFLRNLFGFMVVIGLGIAAYRRFRIKKLRHITGSADRLILALLTIIMVSGFILEAAKIASPVVFNEMVDIYAGLYPEDEEVKPLKAYWAAEYGVVFPGENYSAPENGEIEAGIMEEGRFMHESYCGFCHVNPGWAFISYPVSRGLKPVVPLLERMEFHRGMWYVHFLSCFIALALLPFTKFFHIFSTPVSLLVNGTAGKSLQNGRNNSPVAASRRALDLDACTHCGTCSLHCSVAASSDRFENMCILPSERLAALKEMASGKILSPARLNEIAEGNMICSKCNRCTELCPSGLNLQDLWFACQDQLEASGLVHPGTWVPKVFSPGLYAGPYPSRIGPGEDIIDKLVTVSVTRDDFSECLKCKTCTNSCPVVACCDDPASELDMLPHQMMHALSLGLEDMVLGSRMIWSCTTCYMCQEHCPQGVRITDIFYGLKNLAYQHAKNEVQTPEDIRYN